MGAARRVKSTMKLVNVETPEKNVCKMTFSASAAELEEAAEAVYQRTRDTFTIKGFAKPTGANTFSGTTPSTT